MQLLDERQGTNVWWFLQAINRYQEYILVHDLNRQRNGDMHTD
jgi:hypothetical protein